MKKMRLPLQSQLGKHDEMIVFWLWKSSLKYWRQQKLREGFERIDSLDLNE